MNEYDLAQVRQKMFDARDACACSRCKGGGGDPGTTCMAAAIYLGWILGDALRGVANASSTPRRTPDDGSAGW